MNQKIFSFFVLAAALLVSAGCVYQEPNYDEILELTPSQEEPEMSVTQFLERMQDAMDPKHVWRDSKSYILRQTARTQEKQGFSYVEQFYTTEIRYRQPEQLRQTSFRNGEAFQTLLFRDNKAWVINKNGRATVYEPGLGYELFRIFLSFSNPKSNEQKVFANLELGVVYLNGKRTYRLICRTGNPQIPPYVKYVNAETFLLDHMDTVCYSADGSYHIYRSTPLEYRWMSDVKMPKATRVTIGVGPGEDTKTEEYYTDELLINPTIPDKDFELPASAKIDYASMKE